jgi:hypothetical protein
MAGCYFAAQYGLRFLKCTFRGQLLDVVQRPGRGMSSWRDMVDWIGGYPFEVCSPGEFYIPLRAGIHSG